MSDQKALRRKIAALETRQTVRAIATAETKRMLAEVFELRQREIDNLKAQLTIGAVR